MDKVDQLNNLASFNGPGPVNLVPDHPGPVNLVPDHPGPGNLVKVKGKRGGARPGAGRKRRMDEQDIIKKLSPYESAAFGKLYELIQQGEVKALELYFKYYLGIPTQRIESKIEGNISAISVHVVRPTPGIVHQNDREVL